MRVICFYHAIDFDGKCSAAIVKKAYPNCELVGVDHDGRDFPITMVQAGDRVFMVDYAIDSIETMLWLQANCDFTWIDHHEIVNEAAAKGFNPKGLRSTWLAACELTWQYLFPNDPMPRAVHLLGHYDSRHLERDKDALSFQFGMRQFVGEADDASFWDELFRSESRVNKIIEQGRIILPYVERQNARAMELLAFDLELDGLKCLAVNIASSGSQTFASKWDSRKYDAMVRFSWKRTFWDVSLYTEKPGVDVRRVAQKFGGGGHVCAAGFQCGELPFSLGGA